MRCRAGFVYVEGVPPDGEVLCLCRLRYVGCGLYLADPTGWTFEGRSVCCMLLVSRSS